MNRDSRFLPPRLTLMFLQPRDSGVRVVWCIRNTTNDYEYQGKLLAIQILIRKFKRQSISVFVELKLPNADQ